MAETDQKNSSLFSILREAIVGSERDFTTGSIGTAIFLLAVPMILEMFMESIFAIADIFFVGKLGANAVAIVGITEAMMAIIYAVAIGLSIGATATVARRIGEKDNEGASKSAAHAIYLGLIFSIVIGAIGIIFASDFLSLLGAEPEVIAEGTTFTRIELGGSCVVIFLFLLNGIFRGAGDASVAMRVLFLSNLLNIILSPCFIFGFLFFPKLGVTGAAIGTTIGRGIGVFFAALNLYRSDGRITIQSEHWKFDPKLLWNLLKLSSSAILQFTIGTASWLGLMRVTAFFGSEAVAGYTIGIRIIMFALLPAVGLSNAAATLVGQNLGAERPDRAERSVWIAAYVNAGFLAFVGVIFVFFAHYLVGIFTVDQNVLQYGTNCLQIIAYGFVFYGFGMVLESAFNGAGDTLTPTFLNLFVFWLFEIPLAYILAFYFHFDTKGVYWAITIAFSVLAVVSALLFRRGKWKLKTV